MKVLLTGAGGFLGWHTRVRLAAHTDHEVVAVDRESFSRMPELARGCDAVLHVAGVNRASDDEVERGNVALAEAVAEAVRSAGSILRVVYANTVHAGADSAYGRGKAKATDALRASGADVVDVRLPNLFGEHGRPGYNSFVATFADAVARDEAPTTVQDKEIGLLRAQGAAQAMIDALDGGDDLVRPEAHPTSVREVLDLLTSFRETYRTGDIPALPSDFHVDLFNTLRAALFPQGYPIGLTPHSDDRGRLVETVRSHGGQGQTFVSTTRCGITRGDHYHLGKIERFVVLGGRARISLRRVFHEDVIDFVVDGTEPVAIDMPTMWVHNITNIGDTELLTQFWTHTLFDPAAADTFWEPVRQDVTCS
ncbi:NAD-dependent epimerase/dehydratase family protein [Arsenicicoccus sp. UBA7492]|uniref:polysaccharide biosynthesis C-terminal domain-containing protein n=1 Tax=Arsenicicoccus sp. UBA7492 TaxID=1946057 RepID=UPI00257E1B6E|nr:NAD-dependent epimerase/dehydratase family protein [Arsenicicoccus sp. UBA7492]